jgi:hypothetical protein
LQFPSKSPEGTETPAQGALAKIIVLRRRRKARKNKSAKRTCIPVPSRLR